MASVKNQNANDFDTNNLVKVVDDHAKDIDSINQRLKNLEEKLGNNEKIAATLCEAAENAVKMETMLEKSFLKLLAKNEDVRNKIKEFIKNSDRDFISMQLKSYGALIKICVVFIMVQVGTELIKWLFKLTTGQ